MFVMWPGLSNKGLHNAHSGLRGGYQMMAEVSDRGSNLTKQVKSDKPLNFMRSQEVLVVASESLD